MDINYQIGWIPNEIDQKFYNNSQGYANDVTHDFS